MRGAWESEPGTARPHDALPRRVERRDGRSGVKTNPASSIPLAGIVSDSIPFRKAASFRRPTASIEPSSRADAPVELLPRIRPEEGRGHCGHEGSDPITQTLRMGWSGLTA